jgi:hypothetical protein
MDYGFLGSSSVLKDLLESEDLEESRLFLEISKFI